MEIKIIEESKNKFVFTSKEIDHTMANLLRDELWNDSDVEIAGYNIDHPLLNNLKFFVETKSKKAKDVVMDTFKRLKKKNADLKKAFSKA